jgi:pantoate--beta-alanine ligase
MAGAATVVAMLFLMTAAQRAYFGEKDYQQLLIVKRLARDLDIPVAVVPVPTVREADGMALSSRNVQLTAAQRAEAAAIYRTLTAMAGRLAAPEGNGPLEQVLAWGRGELRQAGIEKLDYLELRCAETLAALSGPDRPARLLMAGWMGPVRLIDNIAVPART